MRQQSTSAQSCTDSSSTYSPAPCSPRPRGPKTTPGIPAAANSAVSVQAAIPDNSIEPVTSRIAPAAAAAIGASGEISYGGGGVLIRAAPRPVIFPPQKRG